MGTPLSVTTLINTHMCHVSGNLFVALSIGDHDGCTTNHDKRYASSVCCSLTIVHAVTVIHRVCSTNSISTMHVVLPRETT